jgi:uncharacterized protein (DUF302 family)
MVAGHVLQARVQGSLDRVRSRVVEALREEGFGILTEIDVQKTPAEKVGEEIEPYVILGACNPSLAYRALSIDRSVGALLPCGVALRVEGDEVTVYAQDPEAMFAGLDPVLRGKLAGLPEEAAARLRGALRRLQPGE